MAFVPIGGNVTDETSRHEAREREERERSPRSSTHDVDAADAQAREPPENDHPEESQSVVETFARRWRNADEEFGSDKICTRVWEEHKLLGMFGDGRFARTYKVTQKSTGKVLALKLCSMRRLGRGSFIPREGAALDHKYEAIPANVPGLLEIAENVQELRLERTLLRCMTGLCPFVMEVATDCGFSCIFDDLEGELGYPMGADIGSLKSIWYFLDRVIGDRESDKVMEALQELLVFWAAQMADALRFLHQCNIIHSDYRPDNFVVGFDMYIRLIDFGKSFVDAGQELLSSSFKPPRSLDGLNARQIHRHRRCLKSIFHFNEGRNVHPAGIWEATLKAERNDKELVQLEKIYEFFKFGTTLFSLQWPRDLEFYSVFDQMCHLRDIEDYRHDKPSLPKAVISGDMLDFINHLIADHTQPGIGFTNSDDLIRHRVFQHIDFDELRAKRIRCSPPVYNLMGIVLNNDMSQKVELLRSEKEKEYCGKLLEKQKQVFRSNYIG